MHVHHSESLLFGEQYLSVHLHFRAMLDVML